MGAMHLVAEEYDLSLFILFIPFISSAFGGSHREVGPGVGGHVGVDQLATVYSPTRRWRPLLP